jgi:GntR family transcriptional regulator
MPVDPQYRRVADALRDAIERGVYPPGSMLPPEPEIAAEHGTTRATVNYAMRVLRGEGLVRPRRGRAGAGGGTYVRPIPQIRRRAVTRYGQSAREAQAARGAFDTEIRAQGMVPRSDVEVAFVAAPARVAETLGTGRVLMRKRRMYADDIPVQLAPSYIPAAIARGTALEQADTGPGGMLSRLAELGHAEVRFTESVRTRRATEEEREFLGLADDAPVMEIWHVGWTADDRAVEVCVHSVPAYGWVLDYEWIQDQPATDVKATRPNAYTPTEPRDEDVSDDITDDLGAGMRTPRQKRLDQQGEK